MIKLSTKKSIYKPFAIEIDGVIYKKDIVTLDDIEFVKEFAKDETETENQKESIEDAYKVINRLTTAPIELLKKIDYRELFDLQNYLTSSMENPEKIDGKKKNSQSSKNTEQSDKSLT